MAKFVLPGYIPPFVGTRDGITIYKMWGGYFMRTASSLTGKRVKKDPAFQKTMQNAGILAQASPIASAIYQLIPAGKKKFALYRQLTGHVMKLLKEGKEPAVISQLLKAEYLAPEKKRPAITRRKRKKTCSLKRYIPNAFPVKEFYTITSRWDFLHRDKKEMSSDLSPPASTTAGEAP